MNTTRRLASAMGLTWVLASCALIHHDTPPDALIPASEIRMADDIPRDIGTWPDAQWWTRYHDPQLDALIAQATANAPSIKIARTRVAQAKSDVELIEAGSNLQVTGIGTIDRTHVSAHGFLGPFAEEEPSAGLTGPWYTSGLVGLGGSLEIDIWGKQRAQIAAAAGVHNARLAETAAIELEVSADVAQIYYAIQTRYRLVDLLQQSEQIAAFSVRTHRARADRGLESVTFVDTALASELGAQRRLAATRSQITALREALRALIGADAAQMPDIAPAPMPQSQTGVPTVLAYELLARRPDLQAMRWYVESSFDRIDAAKAAFYPSFDIKAFFGVNAIHLSELFTRSSQQLNLIPGLYLPIFDGGRLNANLGGARANSNLLIEQYNAAVLEAVRDVAQAGNALQSLDTQASLQRQAIERLTQTQASAQAHYERGLASQYEAVESQVPVIDERLVLVDIEGREASEQIALTQALGGGYSTPAPADPKPR
ncbi:MAG TPA: MdtP family multidrug efflux transporter outer membrane subunit [Pararobbsia sp.]|nr:MdtP family multidrug efflux transporter outer membrane subunit [Pararobbsia sp.]